MKARIIFTIIGAIIISVQARASVTINLGLGELTGNAGTALPDGTLWALISEDTSGNLPGGLLTDGDLYTNNNPSAITSDFAGATLSVGNFVGGGEVVATGSISSSVISSSLNFSFSDFVNLGTGDKLGVYWFPGLTTASNTVPTDTFEIGGFHESSENVASGGNAGLVVPSDGANVNTFYYDNTLTGGASGIETTEFQAVAVPETSTVLLLGVSMLYLIRRRR